MDYTTTYNASEECNDIVITLNEPLDLGNNFTYQHFIDALSDDQVEAIYQDVPWHLDDNIQIVATGNFVGVQLDTNGSDFADHIKPRYDAI